MILLNAPKLPMNTSAAQLGKSQSKMVELGKVQLRNMKIFPSTAVNPTIYGTNPLFI